MSTATSRELRRADLRQRLRRLRSIERENARLRDVLADFLEQEEEMALGNYPGGHGRLDSTLAHEMRYGDDDLHRADLRRIKAARRVLGMPAWWDKP